MWNIDPRKQVMLSFKEEEENDEFFDSADYWLSDDSSVEKGVLGSEELEYEIWKSEPKSIEQRRKHFLRQMGFVEIASSKIGLQDGKKKFGGSSKVMGLDRLTERSEAVSSSSYLPACDSVVYQSGDVSAKVEANNINPNVLFNEEISTGLFAREIGESKANVHAEECLDIQVDRRKTKSWWKSLANKRKARARRISFEEAKANSATHGGLNIKVQQIKKKCLELSALYLRQKIRAHNGFIWTMKFSPDGRYLATGGEDGVVRVWRVMSVEASGRFDATEFRDGKSSFFRKQSRHVPVVYPEEHFEVEESPLQEFHGHSSDVLDLAWSNSNSLLSSSKDGTVRLWRVGFDHCLNVFHHHDYVPCVQWNPVDENYFISGSIDGKVRVWGLSEKRVVDWADIRDVITAVCYQPDAKGFIVGTLTGICHFYGASGDHFQLEAKVVIDGRNKTSGKRITGIQFSPDNSRRVMITSENSKLRVFDGIGVDYKFKGPQRSGSQVSASFTASGKHVVSVGEDSHVYVWNHDGFGIWPSKKPKSAESCEHFFAEGGVSVAVTWSGKRTEPRRWEREEDCSWIKESSRFSLGNWFPMDAPLRGSATWPEEKLPVCDMSLADAEQDHLHCQDHHLKHRGSHSPTALPDTWGLVIVTAGWDGTIRTYQNYGLPVRLR